MTTLKGVLRSYSASVKRIERQQQRTARESAKKFKEQQKIQVIHDSAQAVKDWEEYISILVSLHKNSIGEINWTDISNDKKPTPPEYYRNNESMSKNKFEKFKPSFLDKLFRSTERKLSNLKLQIQQGILKDEKNYNIALSDFSKNLQEWHNLQLVSKGVLNNDPASYLLALQFFEPFGEIRELGSQLSFEFRDNLLDVDLKINSIDTIPTYELKLLTSGKLSKKDMPISRFNELYQDHVCSAVMRVALEVFAVLPIENVRVNAISSLLNQKTGHLEQRPVLSVIFSAKTLRTLNLYSIDPSESVSNFVSNMNFKKATGFSEVRKANLLSI